MSDHLAELREHMTMNYTTDVRESIAWAVREIEQHQSNASEVIRLQQLGDELAALLAEVRNERDMYKQQRADWKAAYEGLVERRNYEINPPVRPEDIR